MDESRDETRRWEKGMMGDELIPEREREREREAEVVGLEFVTEDNSSHVTRLTLSCNCEKTTPPTSI